MTENKYSPISPKDVYEDAGLWVADALQKDEPTSGHPELEKQLNAILALLITGHIQAAKALHEKAVLPYVEKPGFEALDFANLHSRTAGIEAQIKEYAKTASVFLNEHSFASTPDEQRAMFREVNRCYVGAFGFSGNDNALVIDFLKEMMAELATTGKKGLSTEKAGRPQEYDAKKDMRIYDAWQSQRAVNGRLTVEQFKRDYCPKMTLSEIKSAIDRERKRRAKELKKKRRQ